MRKFFALLMASSLLFGCGKEESKPAQHTPQAAPPLVNAKFADLTESEKKARKTLNEVGEKIGTEKCQGKGSVASRKFKNLHNPKVTDEVQTITCGGIKTRIYLANFSSPPKEILMDVVVSESSPHIPSDFAVGARAESIIQLLGKPLQKDANRLVYQVGSGAEEDIVTFKIQNGRVKEITWRFPFT